MAQKVLVPWNRRLPAKWTGTALQITSRCSITSLTCSRQPRPPSVSCLGAIDTPPSKRCEKTVFPLHVFLMNRLKHDHLPRLGTKLRNRYAVVCQAHAGLGGSYMELPISGQAGTCIIIDSSLFHTRLDGNGIEGRRLMHHCFARGKETLLLRHLYIQCIILPRQARDKHRESSKKE